MFYARAGALSLSLARSRSFLLSSSREKQVFGHRHDWCSKLSGYILGWAINWQQTSEMKTVIGQTNLFACSPSQAIKPEFRNALMTRGFSLLYRQSKSINFLKIIISGKQYPTIGFSLQAEIPNTPRSSYGHAAIFDDKKFFIAF